MMGYITAHEASILTDLSLLRPLSLVDDFVKLLFDIHGQIQRSAKKGERNITLPLSSVNEDFILLLDKELQYRGFRIELTTTDFVIYW